MPSVPEEVGEVREGRMIWVYLSAVANHCVDTMLRVQVPDLDEAISRP